MNFANLPSRNERSVEIRPYIESRGGDEEHGDGTSYEKKDIQAQQLELTSRGREKDDLGSLRSVTRSPSTRSPSDAGAEVVGTAPMPDEKTTLAWLPGPLRKAALAAWKLLRFVGPGFMVAVAYIDPGNYSTDVSAGAQTQYWHLFVILMSNIIAVVLQSLAIRLGTVTGMDLAQNCRAHLPKYLNWGLYVFAEAAIIATDIAEVIGSAIALNLLSNGKIPLVAGCAMSIVEVLFILIFYQPNGSLRGLRVFEYGMVGLVLAVVVCFCIQLSTITGSTVGEVFHGYVPTAVVASGDGTYLSCGILGATVMPHSLFLGSGVCKPRVRAFDEHVAEERRRLRANDTAASSQATLTADLDNHDDAHADKITYKPSMAAIKHCLTVSTVELVLSLCIFALFVNSAILITAGASLYGNDEAQDADLFGIYNLLGETISHGAATTFAVALLLSGLSAGIVCTIAGQMVSEGCINWTIKPWIRQLGIRLISIIPSIVVAASVGKEGLNAALNGSQVALSVILPFVSAPLVYFTCRNKFMTVVTAPPPGQEHMGEERVGMRNHWIVSLLAICMWLFIVIMNVALLVFVGLGKGP